MPEAAGDARRLLAHALGLPPGRLTLHLADAVPAHAAARFEAAVAARARRQPVAQIIGRRAFCGHDFIVTPDVLDPRPESEALVAAVLGALPEAGAVRVLDIATGSGCLLLSVLAARPGATGIGTDISAAALAVARRNAVGLGLARRARFRQADWAGGLAGPFHAILANPPYIGAAEIGGLAPEVREWEPRGALTPGDDGLGPYAALLPQAASRAAPGAVVAVECAPWQVPAVTRTGLAAGLLTPEPMPDLSGRPRGVRFAAAGRAA